jgi:hypothetical protein
MNVKDTIPSGLISAAVTTGTPGVSLLAQGDGRAVLSSSRGTQQSWVRTDGEMSVFTYHLVEALTGFAGRPAWPTVNVTEVMDYVGRTVPLTSQTQHDAVQEPIFQYSGTAFPIALVLGGKGLEKDVRAPDPLTELPPRIHSELTVDTLKGKATALEIGTMSRGQAEAKTTATTVEEGGELKGIVIRDLT